MGRSSCPRQIHWNHGSLRVLRLNGSTLKKHGQRLDPDHKDSVVTQIFIALSPPTLLYQESSSSTSLEIEQRYRR
jgi:hypothetical protein